MWGVFDWIGGECVVVVCGGEFLGYIVIDKCEFVSVGDWFVFCKIGDWIGFVDGGFISDEGCDFICGCVKGGCGK